MILLKPCKAVQRQLWRALQVVVQLKEVSCAAPLCQAHDLGSSSNLTCQHDKADANWACQDLKPLSLICTPGRVTQTL